MEISNKPTYKKPTKIKILSQGSYGCIFRPGIGCDKTPLSNQYITKLQRKKKTSENETLLGKTELSILEVTIIQLKAMSRLASTIQHIRENLFFHHHQNQIPKDFLLRQAYQTHNLKDHCTMPEILIDK